MASEALASNVADPAVSRERLDREMRAFGRECSVAATAFTLIGLVALMVVFLGRFRVEFDTRGGKPPALQVISDGHLTRIGPAQQPVDMTGALVLLCAATLAAAMVIFGGTSFHIYYRRIPVASSWTLSICAAAGLAGLILLFTNI